MNIFWYAEFFPNIYSAHVGQGICPQKHKGLPIFWGSERFQIWPYHSNAMEYEGS